MNFRTYETNMGIVFSFLTMLMKSLTLDEWGRLTPCVFCMHVCVCKCMRVIIQTEHWQTTAQHESHFATFPKGNENKNDGSCDCVVVFFSSFYFVCVLYLSSNSHKKQHAYANFRGVLYSFRIKWSYYSLSTRLEIFNRKAPTLVSICGLITLMISLNLNVVEKKSLDNLKHSNRFKK